MPPATRRVPRVKVFKDENANVELPPTLVNKRKRAADDSSAAARKRSALDDKSCNSSEIIKAEEIDDEKKPPARRKSLLGGEPLQQQPKTDIHQLLEHPASEFTPEEYEELISLLEDGTWQEAADLVSAKECWTSDLLNAFGVTDITSLNLSTQAPPPGEFKLREPQRFTLKPFFAQGKFEKLTTLTLYNTALSDDDVAHLRVLPALESLDLRATGISNQALHHLVCHRHTLTTLNISLNSRITDDARTILKAFPNLAALFLRGTSFTLTGVRTLAMDDLNEGCRLLSLPAPVLEFIARRDVVEIPAGYISDPDPEKIANMTLPNLKKNLQFHSKANNKDIQVTGTKLELVRRLTAVLRNYAADSRILEILGRKPAV